MAGSKTFLQPILSETVAGIDTSIQSMNTTIQEVNTTLTPIPDKIDEQIAELTALAETMSSAVQTLIVTSNEPDHEFSINNNSVSGTSGSERTSSYVQKDQKDIFSFKTMCKGSLVIDTNDVIQALLRTNDSASRAYMKLLFEVLQDSNVVASKEMEASTTSTTSDNQVNFTNLNISVPVDENKTYKLRYTMYLHNGFSTIYAIGTYNVPANFFKVKYAIKNITQSGAIEVV